MKKVLSLLLVLFLSLIIIPTVKAEGKYYELKVYKITNKSTAPILDATASDFLYDVGFFYGENGYFIHEGKQYVAFEHRDDDIYYSVAEGITYKDNLKYTFTEEDKNFINSNNVPNNYDLLRGYDGIILKFGAGCDDDTICVADVDLDDKSDDAVIKATPTVEGLSVSFDVTLKNVNDIVKYEILIINNTEEEFKLNVNNFKKSDYIKYEYTFEDGNNIIKPNSNKVLFVTIKYDKEVPASVLENGFEEENVLILTTNEKEDVTNPKTGQYNIVVIMMIVIILSGFTYALLSKKELKFTLSLFALALLIPIVTNALREVTITVNTKVSVVDGYVLEKRYENPMDLNTDTNINFDILEERDFWQYTNNIKKIGFYNTIQEPTNYEYKFDVSEGKKGVIWAYLIWSDNLHGYELKIMANGVIYANPDSSFWFADIHINSIGGLDNLDTSKVTNMQGMFMKYPRRGIVDTYILGIEHLNTRNVTDMSYMFANRNEIRMISVGDNWDTSKVTKSAYMFDGCESLHGAYGTGYDQNHIDIEYARLDSESVPGYLTLGK